ncbi:nitrate reductase associated protein [Oscillatoria sp. FACHB-1407]|uniref:nitrate reductase associated protein n=1 Tax=Oscillatoria sp. FACHB-1407 TaxID=2692847 RepID=UPI001683E2C9|nr:nitrate reductase associated protein [Oscillatoria sp. FACHB-1407]MBD2462207.1 nitrate reductase associated protein [Oscillatoria sp. FACHB-1407]
MEPSQSSNLFQFEADFADSLRCIPMRVRLKLDTCGIKLKLPQWNQFTVSDRQQLLDLPCDNEADIAAYRATLQHLIQDRTGEIATDLAIDPVPAWNDPTTIPQSVQERATELSVSLSQPQWAMLAPDQRFALIKLSRSEHEHRNFLPALKEFGVVNGQESGVNGQ